MRRNQEENPAQDDMRVEHHEPRFSSSEIIRTTLLIAGAAFPKSLAFPTGAMYSGVKAAQSTAIEIVEKRGCTPLAVLKTVETVSFCAASSCCLFGNRPAAIAAAVVGEGVHSAAEILKETRLNVQMQGMRR